MIGTVIAKIGASVLLLPCSFLLLLYLESYVISKKFQFSGYSAHLEMCLYNNIIDTKYWVEKKEIIVQVVKIIWKPMLWALVLGQSKYSVDWETCTLCISTASVLCRRWNDPLHWPWQGIHLWPVSIWLSCRNNLWGNSFGYMWSFIIIKTDFFINSAEYQQWERPGKLTL